MAYNKYLKFVKSEKVFRKNMTACWEYPHSLVMFTLDDVGWLLWKSYGKRVITAMELVPLGSRSNKLNEVCVSSTKQSILNMAATDI